MIDVSFINFQPQTKSESININECNVYDHRFAMTANLIFILCKLFRRYPIKFFPYPT